jgi:uncharacterized protein involved in type VI secretion and phage assembly
MMGLDLLIPQDQPNRFYGVTVGLVTNTKDPDNLGRVKVKFPWLSDQDESYWARVVAPMAGSDRGLYWMPEVNDEVLVAFEQGDMAFPYILGGLWNGKDKPPDANANGENNKRMIKSRSGHTILLDDTKDNEKIVIQDKEGKNKITIDAKNNTMEIKVEKDLTIEAKGKITLKSTENDLAIECKNLTIKTQQNYQLEAGADCKIQAQAKCEMVAQSALNINCAAGVKVNNGSLEVM